MTTITYTPPADPEMFRHSKAELVAIAAGNTKAAKAATAELARRAANKAAKKAAS